MTQRDWFLIAKSFTQWPQRLAPGAPRSILRPSLRRVYPLRSTNNYWRDGVEIERRYRFLSCPYDATLVFAATRRISLLRGDVALLRMSPCPQLEEWRSLAPEIGQVPI